MCLDFHPKTPALLAVGLYDGTVLVYDIRNRSKNIYINLLFGLTSIQILYGKYTGVATLINITFFQFHLMGV